MGSRADKNDLVPGLSGKPVIMPFMGGHGGTGMPRKGTPFTTPLWFDGLIHALKRDNKTTPAMLYVRHTDELGRYLGWDRECLHCLQGLPPEPDAPAAGLYDFP